MEISYFFISHVHLKTMNQEALMLGVLQREIHLGAEQANAKFFNGMS